MKFCINHTFNNAQKKYTMKICINHTFTTRKNPKMKNSYYVMRLNSLSLWCPGSTLHYGVDSWWGRPRIVQSSDRPASGQTRKM